jgi:hypothetical protein
MRYCQTSSEAAGASEKRVLANGSSRRVRSFSSFWRALSLGVVSASTLSCQPAHSRAAADVGGADLEASSTVASLGSSTTNAPAPTSTSSAPASSSRASRNPMRLATYHVDSPTFGRVPAVVRVPEHDASAALPVLVLLHGRGEALKKPERGARGFLDDYALEHNWRWLSDPERSPPKDTPDAFRQSVRAQLSERSFTGMVVVMPYLPDRFRGPELFDNASEYARVLRELAQQVKGDLPVRQDRDAWALDGVSLGGRVAMAGVSELADTFGAVGSVQAAIDERELSRFASLLEQARRQNPALQVTLATSEQDYFRSVLERYHRLLSERRLSHDWSVLSGDHSYAFNRGVGVAHLLLTYDRWFTKRAP